MEYCLEGGVDAEFTSIVPGIGGLRNFTILWNLQQTSTPASEPRYIFINANNSYEGAAFTYNVSQNVFAIYGSVQEESYMPIVASVLMEH